MMYASRGCLAWASAFLVGGHIAVAASREAGVLVSVDVSNSDALLSKPHTRPMVMRGREMAGWLRVEHLDRDDLGLAVLACLLVAPA